MTTLKSSNSFNNKKSQFNEEQLEQINRGKQRNLDTSKYADPSLDADTMEQVRLGLMDKIDLTSFLNLGYNANQLEQIRIGLERGYDISIYADPKFDCDQMYEIREGMFDKVDVTKYADPRFNSSQMFQLHLGLCHKIDISKFADPRFSDDQMELIDYALRCGADVSTFAIPSLSLEEMRNRSKSVLNSIGHLEKKQAETILTKAASLILECTDMNSDIIIDDLMFKVKVKVMKSRVKATLTNPQFSLEASGKVSGYNVEITYSNLVGFADIAIPHYVYPVPSKPGFYRVTLHDTSLFKVTDEEIHEYLPNMPIYSDYKEELLPHYSEINKICHRWRSRKGYLGSYNYILQVYKQPDNNYYAVLQIHTGSIGHYRIIKNSKGLSIITGSHTYNFNELIDSSEESNSI